MNLRAPTLDDVPAITALFNRSSEESYGEPDETEDEVRRFLTSDELDPDEDIRVAERDGEIVGYADVSPHPHPTYWIDVRVPPSGEDAVRTTLIAWAVERVRTRSGQKALAGSWASEAADRRAYEAAGFARIRGSYRMRIDFDGESEEPRVPDGIRIRPMTPGDVQTAYETHGETFEDMWGYAPMSFEDWQHWFVDDDLDWSLWLLAEAGDQTAGVALCRPRPAEPDVGVVRVLGVRRPWRRLGVGRALLLRAFAEFRRRGMRSVTLGVDAESLTGAQRLYASAGMYVERESDVWELHLR